MICESCFGDKFLADQIKKRSIISATICAYCRAERVAVLAPAEIADFLGPVIGLYTESTDVESQKIYEYFRRDWGLLKAVGDNACDQIFDSIFPGENFPAKRFRSRQSANTRRNLWAAFQDELKHKNRFFPQTKIIDPEDLKLLFSFFILKSPPEHFFRARICDGEIGYEIDKMGRPPEKLTKGGRANPIGISYLYTASDAGTAIAEVRPSVGDRITVVSFTANQPLSLLDLKDPRETASPFAIDSDNLLKLLNELDFLCHLGEQLSKAILPKEADLEYLASQYLCEMIKHFNYDGVVYKSSVGQGYNIAFFNDSKVTPARIEGLFSVTRVSYAAEPIPIPAPLE